MKTRNFIWLFLLVFSVQLQAQKRRPTGAKLDDPYATNRPLAQDTLRGRLVPTGKKVLLNYLPVPGNQGKVASCTGFTVAHAMLLMTALELSDLDLADEMRGSGSYIYSHIFEKNCDDGAYLSQALQWAEEIGVCPRSSFSDNPIDCNPKPNARHDNLARDARIKKFLPVFRKYTPDTMKLNWVKQQLVYNNTPVLFDLQVDAGFSNLNTRNWRPDKPGKSDVGHAMVIVGYDETKGKSEFILMNSYGSDWGEKGYCTIRYADFLLRAQNGYVLIL